ncbi:hypothetical protein GCK72_011668 [Caenorhabditis remanei]|uniref:DUF38 domain-containing protein n=1 Tax=Caenorhabditis remanei TaxID=31234 RepID=A0A6A5HAK9_CAERE|nr:hypothetical protein GCK72_011668 [Caenorhabditis remanei]KAF1763402.1 hypothetical protein GCK72_011668 [Caenorhabditis remanei]
MSQNYPRMTSSPITSMGIFYTEKSLKCELYFNDPYGKQSFEYKETKIDHLKNFVEYLEEIIYNQAGLVNSLKIKYSGHEENYTKEKLDPVINQIFKCLESRNERLQVKRLSIDAVDMSQAMRVVKLLDPSVLKKVEFGFENRDEEIDLEDALALVKWNEGQRMKLIFKLHTIRPEYLESVKKFLLHLPTFTEIFVYYKHCVHDAASLRSIMDVPMQHESPDSKEKFIKFRLSHSLLLSAGVVKISLSNDVSAMVLENPLIMKRVIQSFNFWNVQRLRKTSRGIRDCVDFLKPVTHIDEYMVFFLSDIHPSAYIETGRYWSRSWNYGKHEISMDRNVLCQKALAQVLHDFEVNLGRQNTCLEELKFIFSYIDTLRKEENRKPSKKEFKRLHQLTIQFLGKLKEILSRRSQLLKVKVLELLCCTDDNLMQILPYLDPNCLKKIELNDPRSEYERLRVKYPESMLKPFVLDEICQLEQWKKATELKIRSQPISTSIQKMNIIHFSKIWIEVDTISSEDVLYLKEHILLSTTFQRFIIDFKNTTIDYETLHGLIGPPHRIFSDTSRIWFFQMEVNHQFLKRLNQLTIQFLWKLREILSRRSRLLKVKVLKVLCCTDDNLMQILPYLDPNCLKKIEVNDPRSEYGRLGDRVKYPESMLNPFVLDEICQLEQWKSATELVIRSQPISTSIQKMNITEFSSVWIEVDTISSEDVLYLKDHLSLSTTFQRFIIDFKNTTIDYETLHGLIGPPHRIFSDDDRIWFFQMEVNHQFLENMPQNYPRMALSPITSIGVFYTEHSLKCEMHYNDPYRKQSFEYKETRKKNDFLKNFVEYLEEIINNQKSLVDSLKIKYNGLEENYNTETLNPVISQIFECLESRKELLQVKRLLIDAVDMSQAMTVVKLLDPSVLKKVEFCFENRDEDIDIEDALALVDWNEGQRMKLVFKLHTLRPEYLESVKKFLLHRLTFTEIFVYYKNCAHDHASLRTIIDVPMQHETPGSTEKFFKFRLSHSLLLSAGLVKLTLSNDVSAKVLGNPLIMKHVIRSFGFWNVQRLRKTSRGIRDCVDLLKPVTHIDEYMVFFLSDIHPSAYIETGCYSSKSWLYGKHKTSKNRNVLCQKAQAQVLNDFEINLGRQNTCLEKLKFIFSYIDTLRKEENRKPSKKEFKRLHQLTIQFLGKLKDILSKRSQLLKVKVLEVLCCTDDNLMQILPYLDPNCLKKIELNDPRSEYGRLGDRVKYPESMLKPFVLDEICQLEQWKKATELKIRSQPIPTSIQKMNLTEFSKVWIEVDTISSEDVLYLKEHLLLSATFRRFIIDFKNTTIDYETLHGLIGPPHRIFSDDDRIWFFQMEVNHQFLEVRLGRGCLDFDLSSYIRQYR